MKTIKILLIACSMVTFGIIAPTTGDCTDINDSEAERFMTDYFSALQSGDVETILTMLTDPLLSSRRLLLEKNTAYPAFLRKTYADATFDMDGILSPNQDVYIVDFKIFFSDATNPSRSEIYLKRGDSGLKIFNEVPK